MSKKFLTMADKVKDDIDRIKSILEGYAERDIEEIKDKKEFLEEQLKEQEELYIKYKENNEPYYERYTYEHYKNKFFKCSNNLEYNFIYEVSSLVDKDLDVSKNTPSKRIKILENIVKAYNEVKNLSKSL